MRNETNLHDDAECLQAFSNFFVANARENSRKFSSEEELNSKLIYNYAPVFTGKTKKSKFQQKYYFTKPKAATIISQERRDL